MLTLSKELGALTMAAKYSDEEISMLLEEQKQLPNDYKNRLHLREKRGHKEGCIEVTGMAGNQFRLILRQSDANHIDFSIILGVIPQDTSQLFILRRYNGKSHEHTNKIERVTFYDFHIHTATERYQDLGSKEETYAEPTDRFYDFHSALRCMIDECRFVLPFDPQQKLFEEGEL